MKKKISERTLTSKQADTQMNHYWKDLNHPMVTDAEKKKNIKTFSDVMLSYAKKRSTDYSWDEQVVNNIKVKTAHFFKLSLKIAQPEYDHSLYPEQEELIAFAESKGWSIKMWDAAIELEAYTRAVAKKELGK